MSALLVAYQPAAAGSGIPEIIGFLNGTRIKDIFKVSDVTDPSKMRLECRVNDITERGGLSFARF